MKYSYILIIKKTLDEKMGRENEQAINIRTTPNKL